MLTQARTAQAATSSVLQPTCCRSRTFEKRRCGKTKTVSAGQARIAERNCFSWASENGRKELCEVDWMRDRMRSRRLNMWFVATVFIYERQMSCHRHHRTRPLLRCMFPFAHSKMSCQPPFPRK